MNYYGIFEYIPSSEGGLKRLLVMRDTKKLCETILTALEQTNILFDCYKIEKMYMNKSYSHTWEKE